MWTEDGPAASSEETAEVEVQLGHLCPNRCVFCCSGQVAEEGTRVVAAGADVLAAIDEAAARGARRITLLGGEPTVHATFSTALRRAAVLGFPEVVVFTNGARFDDERFYGQVAECRGVAFRVSFQGAEAAVHDAVTRRPGSFDRLVRGVKRLREHGYAVTANTCATSLNAASLPALPDLLAGLGVAQLHVDMVRPEDSGNRDDAYLRSIMPRYGDLREPLEEMLARAAACGTPEVIVGNYPYCLLPAWAWQIHHGGRPTFTVDAEGEGELSPPRDKYARHRASKQSPPCCASCAFSSGCRGLPAKYVELYGSGEVRAVTEAELWRLDAQRAAFDSVVPSAVRGLADKPLPTPWATFRALPPLRSRHTEIHLGGADGRRAVLRFSLAASDRRPRDPRHLYFEVSVDGIRILVELYSNGSDFLPLLDWTRTGLSKGLGRSQPGIGFPASELPRVDRVEIGMGYACNNRCDVCVHGDKRARYGSQSPEAILAALEEGRRRGATQVSFGGGEPTIHPAFVEVVRSASSLGYRTVRVRSNGRRFADRSFCEEVVGAGANEFGIALHGSSAETHDGLTHAPGSFRQTISGLRNLVRTGRRVTATAAVCSASYGELPDVARLAAALRVEGLHLHLLQLRGSAARNASRLAVRLSDAMPFVRAAMGVGLRSGLRVATEGIPLCQLDGYGACDEDGDTPPTAVFGVDFALEDLAAHRRRTEKVHGTPCDRCDLRARCEGVWTEYAALFGWDEISPVVARDPREAGLP